MSSKKYFKQVATEWDSIREEFFSESVRDKAFSLTSIKPGDLVADIGAGTGFITEGLIKKDIKIIAIDLSMEMLRQMESKFRNHTNIDYRPGDAYDLPVQSNMVDFAFANMYLHHIENPLKAIKEIYRILKPGGKLIISDLDKHEFEFLKTEQEDVWMGFNRDDISNWYTKSGFSKVSINGAEEKCSSNSSLSNQRAEISIFIAEGTK